jgi:hypothetical protein
LIDLFTDADAGDEGGSDIDLQNIRVWIDNRIVAWTDGIDDEPDDDQPCDTEGDVFEDFEDFEENAIGNGCFDVDGIASDDGDGDFAGAASFKYMHSTLDEDALGPGEHTLRIVFAGQQGDEGVFFERRWILNVDVTPPRAWINGGFVDSPILSNVGGYVDASEPALTAYLYDREAGIMAKPRQADPILNVLFANLIGGPLNIEVDIPLVPGDPDVIIRIADIELPIQDVGLKMDVWLVDEPVSNDDDDDIDEYFDRNLIQTATADMLDFTPPLSVGIDDSSEFYTPSDTLIARFPLVADLAPYDGREIEVVLYTAKIEHIGHSISDIDDILGDILGALGGLDGAGGSGAAKTDPAGTVVADDEEFTKYLLGPMDCVGNVGSAYVAARFIVDATAGGGDFESPECGGTVTPGGNIVLAFRFDESGAGVDESTLEVTVDGPMDIEVGEDDIEIRDGVALIRLNPEGDATAFAVGSYTVTVTGEDNLGREFTRVCSFDVASPVLSVFGGGVFPNPFDPATGNATLRWTQSQPGNVTIEVYDFAGDFVGHILENQFVTPGMAREGIDWGGTDNHGDDLADGGYLAHIIVTGGGRTQTTDVKIAIDRQDKTPRAPGARLRAGARTARELFLEVSAARLDEGSPGNRERQR